MDCKRIEKEFEKGKALIVGKKGGRNVKVDGVEVHTAYSLSDNPEILDKAIITDEDKLLYICGHGDNKNMKIGGRSMAEIAELLVKAGYTGDQVIYIASCGADEEVNIKVRNLMVVSDKNATVNKRTTMVKELDTELRRALGSKMTNHPIVESDASGDVVTITNEREGIEMWLISDGNFLSKNILGKYQGKVLKRFSSGDTEIDIENAEKDLESYYMNTYKFIDFYKVSLTRKRIEFAEEITDLGELPGWLIGLAVALIIMSIGYYTEYALAMETVILMGVPTYLICGMVIKSVNSFRHVYLILFASILEKGISLSMVIIAFRRITEANHIATIIILLVTALLIAGIKIVSGSKA